MKYLLDFLSALPDGPTVQDAGFQQLLVDVQASKSQSRANDQFYENLEQIVNELKATPEALAFQKPVNRKEAPDYYDVIKHPMDLSTVLKNVKGHRYKTKADFAMDLDLIWENCLLYNSEGHPLRAAARFMKQKADHHLEFLKDRVERAGSLLLGIPGLASSPVPSISARVRAGGSIGPSRLGRGASHVPSEDEDAAGESEDGGDGDATLQNDEVTDGPVDRVEAISTVPPPQPVYRDDRPNLTVNLDSMPAFIRNPQSMSHTLPHIPQAGPSYNEKGKAKDTSSNNQLPPWYPVNDAESKTDAMWWTSINKDEAYTSRIPYISSMIPKAGLKRKRIPSTKKRKEQLLNETSDIAAPVNLKNVNMGNVINRTVDELFEARRIANNIQDFQRIEMEGGVLPPIEKFDRLKAMKREEERERKRQRREEKHEGLDRRKKGGEVGEREASSEMKRATASMLAHSGFDGANEAALDLLTRLSMDYTRNIGRTFRLLVDGFSRKMSSEDIILHGMFENGMTRVEDLEAHVKDDVERELHKMVEVNRKVRQAYKEVTTAPVIQDDMMFADDGEMLMDGNFAEELGEDFLGLREMGIAQEHGMSNLTVPSSLFHGRRKRNANANADKTDQLEFPLPPPFIPLNPSTFQSQVPGLLHSFFASRLESGQGLEDSPYFVPPYNQIGSLGQISSRHLAATVPKKQVVNGDVPPPAEKKKPKPPKKQSANTGVGKGNWIRPSKEDRMKKLAEKQGLSVQPVNGATPDAPPGSEDAAGEEEDAEGEEESNI